MLRGGKIIPLPILILNWSPYNWLDRFIREKQADVYRMHIAIKDERNPGNETVILKEMA